MHRIANLHPPCSPITITVSLRSQGNESIVLNRNVQDEWIVGHNRDGRDGASPALPRGTATPSRFLVDRFTKASQALLSITMSMLNMIK
jgi:hypothetical protein